MQDNFNSGTVVANSKFKPNLTINPLGYFNEHSYGCVYHACQLTKVDIHRAAGEGYIV